MTAKRYAAQIVFTQADEHRWVGKLLNPNAIDTHYGTKAGRIRCVIEEGDTGRCDMMVQGGHVGGRRYSTHDNLTEAQEAAIRWAGRRFKIVVEK